MPAAVPSGAPFRYRSDEEDSGRWIGFPYRDGDIVISTRSKSGTTWMQMICALLVFRTPDLPAPLAELSPWLDWLITPRDDVNARLDAERHRRFIKTHTPLDGIPLDDRATYIVVGRHPLDMAVSLYHQGDNLDRQRIRDLTGSTAPLPSPSPSPSPSQTPRLSLHDYVVDWIERDNDPRRYVDELTGIMWHLSDAWARATRHQPQPQRPDVVLVHYDDLLSDLDGEMRRLAGRLGIQVDEDRWPALVEAATFGRMKDRAVELAPDPAGILKDRYRFFREGRSGAGRDLLTEAELARYHERAAELAPPDLLAWLRRA